MRTPLSGAERWASRMAGTYHSASQLQLSWHFVAACGDTGAASSSVPAVASSARRETVLTGPSPAAAEGNAACRLTKQSRRRARSVLTIARQSSGE